MRDKTSIILSRKVPRAIDRHSKEFPSRSAFLKAAARGFLVQIARTEAERRDLEIINRRSDALLEEKRAGAELRRGPRNPVLSQFLETELDRLGAAAPPAPQTRDPATLDRLFVEILKEVNGATIETRR